MSGKIESVDIKILKFNFKFQNFYLFSVSENVRVEVIPVLLGSVISQYASNLYSIKSSQQINIAPYRLLGALLITRE